jgi:hypothetical protein
MSPRVQAPSVIVLAVAVCVLCGVWAFGPVNVSDAARTDDIAIAVVYVDLEGPADSVSLGGHADPEDADSMSALRNDHAIATSVSVPLTSSERARSIRPDRPPRLVHVG